MLAVWMGTQVDESFPGAWHSDAQEISHHNLAHTRSNVHFSPKLFYLRIHIIEAQDLLHVDRSLLLEFYVRIVLGSQIRTTRKYVIKSLNLSWLEELMVASSEPFDEFLIISVEDRNGPWKDKWVRTQTLVNTLTPRWNEQCTWEIFMRCQILMIEIEIVKIQKLQGPLL
ncbi:hypothetical protein LXL04_024364 [Taraxacum kok-saghyz]